MEFVRVEIITAATKLNGFKKAIAKLGVTGMTVSQVFRKVRWNMKMRFMRISN